MRRILVSLIWLASALLPAGAMSPTQVAVVTPAYQAPGWTGWTPASLGGALAARWRASDLSNGAVSAWADTVAALTPAQATGGLQPVKAATSCNGSYAGVTFDGVDDQLTLAATTGLPSGSTAGEIWIVTDQPLTTADANSRAIFAYGGNASATRRQIRRVSNPTNNLSIFDNVTGLTDRGHEFFGVHTVAGYWSGTSEGGSIDGWVTAPDTATIATLATATARLRIGSNDNSTASQFYQGVVCEIDVTTLLTAAQRAQMSGYHAWAYGTVAKLPWNHPYRWRKP